MQDPKDGVNIMEGLRQAAAAVQAAEFMRAHGRLLDEPGGVPREVLAQLKLAVEVRRHQQSQCHTHDMP